MAANSLKLDEQIERELHLEVDTGCSLASLNDKPLPTVDLSFLDEVFEFDGKEKCCERKQSRRVPVTTSLPSVNQLPTQSLSLTVNTHSRAIGRGGVLALQNAAQAITSGDRNLLQKLPTPSQCWSPSPIPDSMLNADPGLYGFKVHYPPNKYDSSTNTLFLRSNEAFPASFQFSSPGLPKNCLVTALVSYRNPQDVLKLGACRRCLKHLAEDSSKPGSNHFLVSTDSKAYYGVYRTHNVVTVPLDELLVTDAGPTCVYKCVCHSSCILGRGNKKSSLVLIMSLIYEGNEVGRDVMNLHSCCNPKRFWGKHQRTGTSVFDAKDLSPPSPKLPQGKDHNDKDPDLDDEGYYNFTWRGKDRVIFDILTLIKKGHNNGPQTQ